MASSERSKKKVQLWQKAIVHFLLGFIMGFFIGFAPSGKSSVLSPTSQEVLMMVSEQPAALLDNNRTLMSATPISNASFVWRSEDDEEEESESESSESNTEPVVWMTPRRLLIIVTPLPAMAEAWDHRWGVIMLGKMAITMRLVLPPMLWLMVEKRRESDEVSAKLRRTGIMYRHVMYKENFTDSDMDTDHQCNEALRHITASAGLSILRRLSNVYALGFFKELREIENGFNFLSCPPPI